MRVFEFQSTPPRRGRRENRLTHYLLRVFQSTPPRRGRLILLIVVMQL
ncbi:hypothetical protein [Chitinivibrio alkaliphilus]|nr:hypothetical protein [Chitinivibrio alkaliphilus]